MTQKLGLNYRLVLLDSLESNSGLEVRNDRAEDGDGLTLDFNITRGVGASLNQMSLKIYNLSPAHQAQLYQARIDLTNKSTRAHRPIVLQGGHDGALSLIFRGGINEAYTYRQGADLITQIEALDGILSTTLSYVNLSYATSVTPQQIIDDLLKPLTDTDTDISKGATTLSNETAELIGDNTRGYVLSGNAYDLLQGITNRKVFIDLGEINILDDGECKRPLSVRVIDASTGLLGVPKLDGLKITIETIFEPRVNVGEFIEIRSSIAKQFDGQYKIAGIQHSGRFSNTVAGKVTTVLQLFGGDVVKKLTIIN
jgi:hypothetical protein